MKTMIPTIFLLMVSLPSWAATVERPCTPNEKWDFRSERKGSWMNHYQGFLVERESPWMSFSDALHLKRLSRILKSAKFESEFSEYWVGRIFLQLGMESIARDYFQSSVKNATNDSIRLASQSCLTKALDHPSVRLNETELNLLLNGRDLYSKGKFQESTAEFLKIDKRSNLKIESMNDLSWAYLQAGKFPETIGIALQLRSGIFRNTFSPESMMTAIMALNETCSYPDASRMIQLFLKDYGPSYHWLEKEITRVDPYQEIKLALKNNSSVPAKIRTEWIRHPGFLKRQSEINRLIERHRRILAMPAKIESVRFKLKKELIAEIQHLIKHPDPENYREIRKDLHRLVRYNRSTKTLIRVVQNEDQESPKKQIELIAVINQDLRQKTKELQQTLKKVRENIDLIEVEIYQGASKDLLGLKRPKQKNNPNGKEHPVSLAWNWGSFSASELERAEIWEDEIGSLKSDTQNKCH